MSKPIEHGHILEDGLEKIIKLRQDLSGSSKRTIVIDKKGGSYKLIITTIATKTSDEYELLAKIPPDTGARVAKMANKIKVTTVNKIR